MNINYFDRKEKQVDLQKKIQSSNMLNAVSKAMIIWNLYIQYKTEINCYILSSGEAEGSEAQGRPRCQRDGRRQGKTRIWRFSKQAIWQTHT